MELHFDELPSQELEVILHQRCSLPLSYAKKLVAIMLDLQVSVQEMSLRIILTKFSLRVSGAPLLRKFGNLSS